MAAFSTKTMRIQNFRNLSIIACLLFACSCKAFVLQIKSTRRLVQQWLVTKESGLSYKDLVVGDGPVPGAKDFVSVHYEGRFQDGKLFDTSRPENDPRADTQKGKPLQFALGRGQVIPGWEEGVKDMKVGGKRKLFIPAKLAYGDEGTPDGVIQPNTDLVFDVELVSVDTSMDAVGGIFTGFQVALGLIVVNGLFQFVTGHELREYVNAAIN